ncbi:MAG: flavin reductase family protein [Candidatus Lambdaproteobacteria bacterium]|nr:flavin reductase family protein [Candidatus Lambdaproteobacteria bacterium]
MAHFANSEQHPDDLHKLVQACVVPRPIAFVSSITREGNANLAPFSYFNAVGGRPPTLMFSVGDREGEMKDTAHNVVHEVPEFVVHIVSEELAEAMNVTSGEFGAHVDEFREAGLTAAPGAVVRVPWVREAPVAMECRFLQHVRIGRNTIIFGEVVYWHIADGVLDARGRVDAGKLKAVGRLGGMDYTRTRDRFTIVRPVIAPEDPRSVPSYRATQAQPPALARGR